tara:strand:+ start:439 stop:729 length:291 start_codon:yes stop_codon:yes gene_type:complete
MVLKKPIEFIDYIRNQKCVICYSALVDPDHLDQIGMGRNRNNPDLLEHLSCIPICRKHHTERHTKSLKDFEDKYKVNLWKENHEYLMKWIEISSKK